MHFISAVGTQPIAIISPLASLIESGTAIERVCLLSTWKRDDQIARVKELKDMICKKFKLNKDAVQIVDISSGSAPQGERPPFATCLKQLTADGGWIFNLAGGMNWMLAQAAYVLDLEQGMIIYPMRGKVACFQMHSGKLQQSQLPEADLPLNDILKLHHLDTSNCDHEPKPQLQQLLERHDISIPKEVIFNLKINDVIIDMMWKNGSQLCFLCHYTPERDKNSTDIRQEIREIATLATGKELFSEIYHRRFFFLTTHKDNATRFTSHSRHKADVVYLSRKMPHSSKRRVLQEIFTPPPQQNIYQKTEIIPANQQCNGEGTAMMAIGNDILPTLNAIWTHSPVGRTTLLYTPMDKTIQKVIEPLKKNANLLPASELCLMPTSIEGMEVLDYKLCTSPAVVNISPGNKSQGFFLAYFAKSNNAKAYSFRTDTNQAQELLGNAALPIKMPLLEEYLALSGESLESATRFFGNESKGTIVLQFLQQLKKEKLSPKVLWSKNRTLGNKSSCSSEKMKIENKNTRNVTISLSDGSSTVIENLLQGYWFEEIVAVACCKAGMENVYQGVRIKWDPKKQQALKLKYPGQPHFKIDRDVVGSKHGIYWLISCKARQIEHVKKDCEEATAVSEPLGRFSKALVCYLYYDGEPQEDEKYKGTYYFGWKTLVDPQALSELFEKVLKKARKAS